MRLKCLVCCWFSIILVLSVEVRGFRSHIGGGKEVFL